MHCLVLRFGTNRGVAIYFRRSVMEEILVLHLNDIIQLIINHLFVDLSLDAFASSPVVELWR